VKMVCNRLCSKNWFSPDRNCALKSIGLARKRARENMQLVLMRVPISAMKGIAILARI
jgi:hypothetical protein